MSSNEKCAWDNNYGATSWTKKSGWKTYVSEEKFCCQKCYAEYSDRYSITWKKKSSALSNFLGIIFFIIIVSAIVSSNNNSSTSSDESHEDETIENVDVENEESSSFSALCPYCGNIENVSELNVYHDCSCGERFFVCKQRNSNNYGIKSEWMEDGTCDCEDCDDETL
jgi:hypothetical protein